MKRRDALKNIGLAAGFAVITPNIFGMLQGCSSDKESWTPSFFNSDEHSLVSSIIDVFLPKTTETPSASEVKVTEFIDTYIHQILNEKDQQITRSGFHNVISILTSNGSSIESVTTEAYKKLLEDYMFDEEINQVDDEYKYEESEKLKLTTSEFLNQLKLMTIFAYKNSEFIGENVLAYDPIPTAYYCGDLQELTGGKSWSL